LADHWSYQLSALTCLYIAVKVFGRVSINAMMMEEIGYGAYRAEEIIDTEMIVLEALGWRLNGPTPQEFACLLLVGLTDSGDAHDDYSALLGRLSDRSNLRCEQATADYDLSATCDPSAIAMASLLDSLEDAGGEMMGVGPSSCKSQNVVLERAREMMPDINVAQVRHAQSRLRQLYKKNACIDSSCSTVSRTNEAPSTSDTRSGACGRREVEATPEPCNKVGADNCSSPDTLGWLL